MGASGHAAPSAAQAATGALSRKRRGIVIAAALATMILALLDTNIVVTAAWPIAHELDPVHGLERLPWLIASYALAGTVSQPLYGKLVDVYGPKAIYLLSSGLFLVGSACCGLAQDMTQLIAFRAVQGLGGGGLMSTVLVIVAALFPPRERAGASGAGGVMVGLGMVLGPVIGGLLAQHLSWHWVFFINLPLGVLAWIAILVALRLPRPVRRHHVDYLGAGLIAGAASVLLVQLELAGASVAWTSPRMIGLGVASLILLAAFLWRQLTAQDPIFPMALFRNTVFRIAAPLQFVTGFALTGCTVYIALYLQTVRGSEPTEAGLRLLPIAAGMILGSAVGGWLVARLERAKGVLVAGSILATSGLALLSMLRRDTPSAQVSVDLFLLGMGLGQIVGLGLLVVQNAVAEQHLGSATTSIRFLQTMGGAIGTAVFGVIFVSRFESVAPGIPAAAIAHGGRELPPDLLPTVLDGLVRATDGVFAVAAVVMAIGVLLTVLLPNQRIGDAPVSATAASPSRDTPVATA